MKIVIDIPRKTYEHIRADGGHGYFNIYDEDNRIVTKAVFNGTPLPKGHGRLIDADVLNNNVHYVPLAPIFQGDYVTYRYVIFADILDMLPTIIEGSDKE